MFGKSLTEIKKTNADERIVSIPEDENHCRSYIVRKEAIFTNEFCQINILYDKGSTIFKEHKIDVNEIVLSTLSGSEKECLKLAIRLARKYKIVLANNNNEQRIKAIINGTEQGRFHVKEFSSQMLGDALPDLIWWHLCGISQANAEFCFNSAERLPVRRLRVEIRKLRAVFTMLEKVLLPEIAKWQQDLRLLTIKLGSVRELDVAISSWRSTALNKRKYSFADDKLAIFLHKERTSEVCKIRDEFTLCKITPFLLELMCWSVDRPIKTGKKDILLEKIANKKLAGWFDVMQKIVKEHPGFDDDGLAHEVRIKAKTSRYVMQSMSGKAFGDNNKVMRSIKRLQDALGVLHDNYVNEEIIRDVVKKQTNHNLIYQAGIFVGNERYRAIKIRKILPDLWEKFVIDWHKWY